jgi:hypothetical protein
VSAQEHLALQRADQKTRSDRWWDVTKIGGGFVAGLLTAWLAAVIKTWIDCFQALR